MQAPTTDLVRARRDGPELRADGPDASPTMAGHVITWDDWYEVHSMHEGRFLERVQRGAASKTIDENRDAIKVLFDHGHDPDIGNKVLGTLDELAEDDTGLRYGVGLFDTEYVRELLPGLRAGVYGSSHRFRAVNEVWANDDGERSSYNPDGLPERTVTELGLFELGAVTFPANQKSTAGVRCVSTTDEWRAHESGLVTPEDRATPDREPAPEPPSTEPPRHSGLTPAEREAALRRITLQGRQP